MSFYERIVAYYDYIFPPNPKQVQFVVNECGGELLNQVLDVGCGTGNLTQGLADVSKTVTGIDTDAAMVAKAKNKYPDIPFICASMLELQTTFDATNFDIIVSFGNTLPHLASLEEVALYFKQCYVLLTNGGKLLVQLINYDRILEQQITALETIDNDTIRFERKYEYDVSSGFIRFNTVLFIKEAGGKPIANTIPLLPVRRSALEKLLHQSGFRNLQFYGSFNQIPITPGSVPMIFSAEK